MAKMKIAAIILAAGQSVRFGGDNKLFAPYKGEPLIHHCLNLVDSTDFQDRILVTGFEHESLDKHIEKRPIRNVFNPHFERGLGSSLAKGVESLGPGVEGFMVFLADMPDLTPETIGQIKTAFEARNSDQSIVRPMFENKPGHPVLFSIEHRAELQSLSGDQGAFEIIQRHASSTLEIDANTPAVIRDIDQKSDLT